MAASGRYRGRSAPTALCRLPATTREALDHPGLRRLMPHLRHRFGPAAAPLERRSDAAQAPRRRGSGNARATLLGGRSVAVQALLERRARCARVPLKRRFAAPLRARPMRVQEKNEMWSTIASGQSGVLRIPLDKPSIAGRPCHAQQVAASEDGVGTMWSQHLGAVRSWACLGGISLWHVALGWAMCQALGVLFFLFMRV